MLRYPEGGSILVLVRQVRRRPRTSRDGRNEEREKERERERERDRVSEGGRAAEARNARSPMSGSIDVA